MKQITICEWKLIVNAGVSKYARYSAAKLIRASNMSYTSGIVTLNRIVANGLMVKEAINGLSYRVVLTDLGVELRDILMKI